MHLRQYTSACYASPLWVRQHLSRRPFHNNCKPTNEPPPQLNLVFLCCCLLSVQLKNANCFPVLLKAVCTLSPQQQAQAQPFLPILATVAQRCADYQAPADVTCPDGSKITAGAAPAAAGAGNSSAGAAGNNTGAAGSTSFPTIAAALQAANGTDSNITTFIAAVESAGEAATPRVPLSKSASDAGARGLRQSCKKCTACTQHRSTHSRGAGQH